MIWEHRELKKSRKQGFQSKNLSSSNCESRHAQHSMDCGQEGAARGIFESGVEMFHERKWILMKWHFVTNFLSLEGDKGERLLRNSS